ncbi:MAG: flagellar biosynthesis protein FliQ [Treponema sp.]|jgi:flagellar biosynthetic protein FliQ|nr:flagellar biosynthesis protein FliQ [Treponema sp.]
MSLTLLIELMQRGIFQIVIMVAPVIVSALAIGLVIAILQAASSIQEQTLTFAPKFFVILGVLALLGGWMFTSLRDYAIDLFGMIPTVGK